MQCGRYARFDGTPFTCDTRYVKTMIDLPEDLLERARAEAVLRGRKLQEMFTEGIRRVLDHPDPAPVQSKSSLHDRMSKYCGIVSSGVGDLSSNPRHLETFGED